MMRLSLRPVRWAAVAGITVAVLVRPLGIHVRAQLSDSDVRLWFQTTEQSLMDATATGDTRPWDEVMDERCALTTEEGEVRSKAEFLKDLRPLPSGLSGRITVKDLAVDTFETFAIVRFLADESETVFGQTLATRYRVTDTYRRSGPKWKMIASHVSVVTVDPPAQRVSTTEWPRLVGTYQLMPNGWKFHVALREGRLYGATNENAPKRLIPLTPTAFVREGTLGEWLFVVGPDNQSAHIVDFRKFEPLIWTRISEKD